MKAIFFDLDGTLTDPAQGIVACLQHAIQSLSGPTWADSDLRRFIGPPLHDSFQEISHDSDPELIAAATRKVDLLGHLLEQEGLAPFEACMVGDRRHDIEGARANGLPTLGVLWGYGSRAELIAAKADALVETVSELPAALNSCCTAL